MSQITDVKRYGFGAVSLKDAECLSGAFILYPDYDRAVARIEELELEVKHWMEQAQSYKPAWDAMKTALNTCVNSHEKLIEALRKAERCLTELYPSEPCRPEHEAEYYAVNRVLNDAREALREAYLCRSEEPMSQLQNDPTLADLEQDVREANDRVQHERFQLNEDWKILRRDREILQNSLIYLHNAEQRLREFRQRRGIE